MWSQLIKDYTDQINKDYTDQINDAYQQVLGRDADPSGLETYSTALDNNPNFDIISSLKGSDEYRDKQIASKTGSENILADYLKYNPQFAAQAWDILQEYAPKEAALSYDLFSQYMPQYSEMARQQIGLDRASDIGDVESLAGSLQGIRAAAEDPAVTAMRQTLLGQVGGELEMGTQMTPEQNRDVTEATRSAQFSRGFGTGQGSANREAINRALEGRTLLAERQQKASTMLGQEYAASPDPFSAILGRPATATTMGQSSYGADTPSSATMQYMPSAQFYQQQQASDLQVKMYESQLALARQQVAMNS